MAQNSSDNHSNVDLQRAVRLLAEALDIVDAQGGHADVAAYIDFALRRLRDDLAPPLQAPL